MVISHFPVKWSMLRPTVLAAALLWLGLGFITVKRNSIYQTSFASTYDIIRDLFLHLLQCFVASFSTIKGSCLFSHPTEMKQYDLHKNHLLTDGTALCLPTTQSMFVKFLTLQGLCWGKWALRPLFSVWVHGLVALTTLSLCLVHRDFRFNELMPKLSWSAQKVIA